MTVPAGTPQPLLPTVPEQRAEVLALLAERRTRLYAQARFTASARRAAWATIRNTHITR